MTAISVMMDRRLRHWLRSSAQEILTPPPKTKNETDFLRFGDNGLPPDDGRGPRGDELSKAMLFIKGCKNTQMRITLTKNYAQNTRESPITIKSALTLYNLLYKSKGKNGKQKIIFRTE